MTDDLKILVSNLALPSARIGSWVTRINRFNEKNDFFDAILSPSNYSKKHYYCKKRKFITWHKRLRNINLIKWVAKDYLNAAIQLSKSTKKMRVVIMDDPHLLEAFVIKKKYFHCPIEIIFSFHGYQLSIKEKVINKVDKVLFLSNSGYKSTKDILFSFTPEVFIIGNCIDSREFYPLKEIQKQDLREKFGYTKKDVIITWMANDRPDKGLHLFKKIKKRLLKKHPHLKFFVIGSNEKLDQPNCNNIGRVPNNEIAKYLQIGDYYFFTTLCKEGFGLSMIEAYKTGNTVIASNNGAIEEITEKLDDIYLVENPNVIQDWVLAFEKAIHNKSKSISDEEAVAIWNYEDWKKRFIDAINF